jgi:predicted RNA-binding protein with PUA-like domain
MNYFLAKTDPETYSIDDLEREKKTAWDGVTNPQAVRVIRSEARDDPKNSKSAVVDIEYVGRLNPTVTLAEIKESKLFDDWALVRQGRLSTMSAPEKFVAWMRKRYPDANI